MKYHVTLNTQIRFIDLFSGIGGFRFALEHIANKRLVNTKCVFSSDLDRDCQKAYSANFNEIPAGDITKINAKKIPDHDLLLAGFPCQPFSIIGQMKGFEDTRGTLFFDIARILEAKKPKVFVLENVKLLAGHNNGRTLAKILAVLKDLKYNIEYRILNALDFGLPQKRERIWIVGFLDPHSFDWPEGNARMKSLNQILEKNVPTRFFASEHIQKKRFSVMQKTNEPTIWHENKAGHISAYPYSCALRAGASYNYLLVNGERRLTPREMLRLQGFPEHFKIACTESQTRRQVGNSLPINVAKSILENIFESMKWGTSPAVGRNQTHKQLRLLEKPNEKAKVKNRRKIQTTVYTK